MATALMEELTKVQRKQNWKDRALLRLVVEHAESYNTELADAIINYIKRVADEDNKRLQECMERQSNA
jgi:CHASE3 domain sensor protein